MKDESTAVVRAVRSRLRDARLRRHLRGLLRQLDLPLPLEVGLLCERLGRLRGTPIALLEWELEPTGPSGMLVSRVDEDVIVFQSRTSRAHQAHIILHEVGHIVAQDLDGVALPQPLLRTSYTARDERDAEIIASTIMHRALSMTRRLDHVAQVGGRSVQSSLVLWDGWS